MAKPLDDQPRPDSAGGSTPPQPGTGFRPPTADQLTEHLEASQLQPVPTWRVWAPSVVLGLAVAGLLFLPGWWGVVLPLAVLIGLMAWSGARVTARRRREAEARGITEAAMLRRYPKALRRTWTLLPQLVYEPMLHGRLVTLLVHSLDEVGAHEAALVGYDYLIAQVDRDHPAASQFQAQRAISALQSDRLFDADESLRKLRGVVGAGDQDTGPGDGFGPQFQGVYRFATLLQAVKTRHYQDAAEGDADLIETLRPLGVDAGYGYGLMAFCWRPLDRERSRYWWDLATTLLPPTALARRFPELRDMAEPGPGDA